MVITMPGMTRGADNFWPRSPTFQIAHSLISEIKLINVKHSLQKKAECYKEPNSVLQAIRIIQVQRGEESVKSAFQRESLQEVTL